MHDTPASVYPETRTADSLARASVLERQITELCAHINAAGYRLLGLIAELDEQQPWGAWGLRSCAHFLNWRCGIGLNAAQVETLVRGYRRVARSEEREQAAARQAARELRYYHDDDGCLVIRARLPAEEGEVVIQALNATLETQRETEREPEPENVTAEAV